MTFDTTMSHVAVGGQGMIDGSQSRVGFGDDTDLRDQFAVQAMAALLRDWDCPSETMDDLTETAYRIANKMLSARARVPQDGPYLRVTKEQK